MEKEYINRLFDNMLSFALQSRGAVLVEGPKWCGKSTTCKRHASEIVDLMPLKNREKLIKEAKLAPDLFLRSREKPLLIDEWQHIGFIWDQIKVEVDEAGDFGQFILTSSVTDKDLSDEKATGNNAFMMVITKGNIAYKRDDGVYVVPLGCLRN